jgi:catechol 2,3-dioxygenase-like lactoylglutathione lyase family enzyme
MKFVRAIVFVKDLERMKAFYRDRLGLAVLHEEPGWIELDGVALHAIPPAIAAHIAIEDPPRARESTPIKLVFVTDDPSAVGDGLDPEGNVFQIALR